ncbi:MAG: bacillithiol biosynthesis deacetylase BshB1 [Calditrichaceae bacterium]|nr:bacillithiol biosynthesis deacetylase BshB1 [Calditrichaceae bacterium]MBN2710544.1 bacillithiol biosynthesis deacetylase BshB1 [Calditrichaceae bacterium]RQV96542.1 MAG: bacillithiol biosynthesis deacetylase BshB1 [Calditrichota bacterium]
MKLDVLAFAPHPDDVELFCGGTMLKLVSKGFKTGLIDLTRGELGSNGNAELRGQESAAASKILGVSYRKNLEIPDGNIENIKLNQLKVINEIRKTRPDLVILPYRKDRHPDHENASVLLKDSVFYSGLVKIETDDQAYRPENIVYYYMHNVEQPVVIVDISDFFDKKIEAVSAYKSQFFEKASEKKETFIGSKTFWDFIGTRARYHGFKIGVEFGEPFFVEHPVKFNNLYKFFA